MSKLKHLLNHEAAPGVLLLLATVAALVVANTGADWYGAILETYAHIGIGAWVIEKPLLLWINDGLMAVFFLLVGLELKREILFGELSSPRKVVLPLLAAIGGVVVPSGIYALINRGDTLAMNGWAIPAATDIAFAFGILAVLGNRVPFALRILLVTIAVIDDLAAILIIAIFYTNQLSLLSLGFALVCLAGLFVLNRLRVRAAAPYVLLGIALWVSVLKSGVHATLAGVALAAFIPPGKDASDRTGLVYRIEHGLTPWVGYGILPLFAFANAGVSVLGLSIGAFFEPVPLGIALGLFLGKQIGVFGAAFLAVKAGFATLPAGIRWGQVYGIAALCGIGFTMSLFISSLAFEGSGGQEYSMQDRLGILTGSFLSAVLGILLLRKFCPVRGPADEHALGKGSIGHQDEGRVR